MVDNSDGVAFLDAWLKWNAAKLDLGCPLSKRFEFPPEHLLAGYIFQAFKSAVLQAPKAGAERGKVSSMLLVDVIADQFNREDLLRARGVPSAAPWTKNFPSGDGASQLAWAKEKAFASDKDRIPPLVKFYSSDGQYFELVGMPLSSPEPHPDGSIYMRAQKGVLVLRPGHSEVDSQVVTLMDLSQVMLEAGVLPRDATIPVPRTGAPTLRITEVTLPGRLRIPADPWVIDVQLDNGDPQMLLSQGFKATLQVAWPGTGASAVLENPKLIGNQLQFSTSGVPDEVAAKIRGLGGRTGSVSLALTPQLEGQLFGGPWRTNYQPQTFERRIRDSSPVEDFFDLAPGSYVLGLVVLLLAGLGLRIFGVPVLRSLGRLVMLVIGAVMSGPGNSRRQRVLHGSLELGSSRIWLGRFQPNDVLTHLSPGKISTEVPIRTGASTVHVRIGTDRTGDMYIGLAEPGSLILNGERQGRGLHKMNDRCRIQIGALDMRFNDDRPVRAPRQGGEARGPVVPKEPVIPTTPVGRGGPTNRWVRSST